MTGLNHDWDKGEGPDHADFVHGAVDPDDFYKEVNYRPRKKKKGCKKSSKGLPCSFTKKIVRHSWYNSARKMWAYNTVMQCERCHKNDWSTYQYGYSKEPIN